MRYQRVLPFPSPLHHHPLVTLTPCYTGATSNASAITQMEQEGTSSGPTNMRRECALPEEQKMTYHNKNLRQKSKYYSYNVEANVHNFTAPVAA